jgi:septum formation protein
MSKNDKTKLILGSASLARKKVLEDAGFTFDIKVADIDEKQIRLEDFDELVMQIAEAKLSAILSKNTFDPDTIIITSDWVASHNGQLREKPTSKEEVIAWHKEYSNSTTMCHCGIVAHHVGQNKTLKAVDNALISWLDIPDKAVKDMVDDPKTYTMAAFPDRSFLSYVKKLDGSVDTVLGLPIRILENFLEELGYYE